MNKPPFDEDYQLLKAKLLAAFERTSRKVEAHLNKTKMLQVILDEESLNGKKSRLTQKLKGAQRLIRCPNTGKIV